MRERQRDIVALEGRDHTAERLIQCGGMAEIALPLTRLPRTAEVTDLTVRPMLSHESSRPRRLTGGFFRPSGIEPIAEVYVFLSQ